MFVDPIADYRWSQVIPYFSMDLNMGCFMMGWNGILVMRFTGIQRHLREILWHLMGCNGIGWRQPSGKWTAWPWKSPSFQWKGRPHWGVLTVGLGASAWSGCSIWAPSFLTDKTTDASDNFRYFLQCSPSIWIVDVDFDWSSFKGKVCGLTHETWNSQVACKLQRSWLKARRRLFTGLPTW